MKLIFKIVLYMLMDICIIIIKQCPLTHYDINQLHMYSHDVIYIFE